MRLQPPTGTKAYQLQLTKLLRFGAHVKIDIGQRIKLVDHNINIVTPYSRRNHRKALPFVSARNGTKLTAFDFAFARFKMLRD